MDLPYDAVGEYDTSLSLSMDALSREVSDTLREAASTNVSDHGGDVSILLDGLNQHFVDEGDVAAVALLAADRATTSLEADLDARLLTDGAGPSIAMNALADELGTSLARVEVNGFFTIGPDGVLSFRATQVSAGGVDSPAALLDLAPLGVHARAELTASLLPMGGGAQLDSLTVQLPAGVMAQARMRATALREGLDATAPWLVERASCDSFASFVAERPTLAPLCDSACALTVCGQAVGDLWVDLAPALAELDVQRSGVDIRGRLELLEDTGDLRVDRIHAARLSASTTGEAATPITLEASVDASRTAFLP